MKIVNVQTNAETITLGGSAADLPAGFTIDVGDLAAVIRGSSYSDDGTNIYTVTIQPGALNVSSEIDPLHEFTGGFQTGLVIAPVLLLVIILRKHFARGDAFD